MKKRDLVLDFTSLLDVIMIILFVVISNMGLASLNAKEEAQAKYDESIANIEKLQIQLEQLTKENNLYKAKEGNTDVNEVQLYESLMEKSQKITLICTPYINSNKSDGNAVEITIYSAKTGSEQEAADVVTFTHNFDLTREERTVRNAEMQNDMYRSLEKILKKSDLEFVLITIEYTYGDKNFSQTDLNIIIGAIDDIERNYSVTCYIDKIKQ